MRDNIYLKALEIGYNLGDEGISFNVLNENLNKLKYVFDKDLFRDWFYRTFEHKARIGFINQPTIGITNKLDDNKLRLSSDSLFQYLEYIELKEARENSITAKKDSKLAILIALVSLLVSGGFSVADFFHQPKPDKQTEIQLKELIEINNGNQKVLDSCLYELRKLHSISVESKKSHKLNNKKMQ
jgi:hypothetical protein